MFLEEHKWVQSFVICSDSLKILCFQNSIFKKNYTIDI